MEYESGRLTEDETDLKRCMDMLRRVDPGTTLEHGFSSNLIPLVARITGLVEKELDVARESGEAVLASSSATNCFAIMATPGVIGDPAGYRTSAGRPPHRDSAA